MLYTELPSGCPQVIGFFSRRRPSSAARTVVIHEWGYPRHVRGVTDHPGLYAVGLPWLYTEGSSVIAGVGDDAAHVVEHIAGGR